MTTVMMVTPYPPQDDGIGIHAYDLRSALSGSSEVSVLTRSGGGRREPDVYPVVSSSPLGLVRSLGVLRRSRPRVVHFQFNLASFGAAWLWVVAAGLVARRRWSARLVFTMHEVRRDVALLGRGGELMYRVLGRLADAVIVYTGEARDLLVGRCRVQAERVSVVPHGCRPSLAVRPDVGEQEAVAARYGLGREPILCLGYIHPDKGLEHLVKAAGILVHNDPGALGQRRVVVAGKVRTRRGVFRYFERKDHRYETTLRRAVAEQGLEDIVRFVGPVEDRDLATVLGVAFVAVLPYNNATQSGVLNLLVGAGTPVVASRLPGLAETLGDAGLYFDAGDSSGLADQLRRVLLEEGLRGRLIERMAAIRDEASYAAVAERLSAIYESVTSTIDGSPEQSPVGERTRVELSPPKAGGGTASGDGRVAGSTSSGSPPGMIV